MQSSLAKLLLLNLTEYKHSSISHHNLPKQTIPTYHPGILRIISQKIK